MSASDPCAEEEQASRAPLVAVVVLLLAVVAVGALLLFTTDNSEAPGKARSEVCMKVSYEATDGTVPARLCYFPPE